MKKREWPVILLSLCFLLGMLELCGAALVPFGNGFGATWGSFRAEPEDSVDVLFLGSSIVYCDVIPALLYEESGIASYVMAGPEQTMPITYYYLREACRTQSPSVVVLEISSLFFLRYQNYTMANLMQMPYDENRFLAIAQGAEPEARGSLLLPVLKYHERAAWLTVAEMRQQLSPSADPLAGYTLLTGGHASGTVSYRADNGEVFYQALRYLRKISDYCSRRGITLITYQAPCWYQPDPNRQAELQDLLPELSTYQLDFLSDSLFYSLHTEAETDWYDDLHFNVNGAEKFTRSMAVLLREMVPDLPDHRPDTDWESRVETFYQKQQ